jgi:hypothetical protein
LGHNRKFRIAIVTSVKRLVISRAKVDLIKDREVMTKRGGKPFLSSLPPPEASENEMNGYRQPRV